MNSTVNEHVAMISTSFFVKENCTRCSDGVCDPVCYIWLDLAWGAVHLIIGVIGIMVNAFALYVFYKLGVTKPYYIVIIFETVTDFIVSVVSMYSAIFLLSGRDSYVEKLFPLCQISGMLWNWNMVTTPLLLSIAGLLRIEAVYFPHNKFLKENRRIVVAMCVTTYVYGVVFATFPYYFPNFGYTFDNEWSICDFIYDAEKQRKIALFYSIIMGPLPMFLSLIIIIVTNVQIAWYLIGRYKGTWKKISLSVDKVQGDADVVQSKQVILSLLFMSLWYVCCYSLIIYNNFKNLLSAYRGKEVVADGLLDLGRIETTYFYAAYNFSAYLNSFINPFIHFYAGNSFRKELYLIFNKLKLQCIPLDSDLRSGTVTARPQTEEHQMSACKRLVSNQNGIEGTKRKYLKKDKESNSNKNYLQVVGPDKQDISSSELSYSQV